MGVPWPGELQQGTQSSLVAARWPQHPPPPVTHPKPWWGAGGELGAPIPPPGGGWNLLSGARRGIWRRGWDTRAERDWEQEPRGGTRPLGAPPASGSPAGFFPRQSPAAAAVEVQEDRGRAVPLCPRLSHATHPPATGQGSWGAAGVTHQELSS